MKDIVEKIWASRAYLKQYALKWTTSEEDAEDVVTLTQIRAVRYADSFKPRNDPDRDLKAWLRCICYSRSVNLYHKNTKRERTLAVQEGGKHIDEYGPTEKYTGFDKALVHHAIRRLKPYFKELIVLFYFEGLSYVEMSERLQIPMGTVMSRLYRARKTLARSPLIRQAARGLHE